MDEIHVQLSGVQENLNLMTKMEWQLICFLKRTLKRPLEKYLEEFWWAHQNRTAIGSATINSVA